MAVTTRAYNRNDAGIKPSDGPPDTSTRRPFTLSKGRATIIIVFSYVAAALLAAAVFSYLETKDERAWQVTLAFGALALFLCIRALYMLFRRPRHAGPHVA